MPTAELKEPVKCSVKAAASQGTEHTQKADGSNSKATSQFPKQQGAYMYLFP